MDRRDASSRSGFESWHIADPDREAASRYIEYLDSGRDPHPEIEDAFIRSVVRYSIRLGISADAWRSLGVPDHVLRAAGMD